MMLQNTFCHLILKHISVRPGFYPSQVERCLDYGEDPSFAEYSGPLRVIWAYFLVSGLLNSLTPGICNCYLKSVIFKHISVINILNISFEIAIRWMPLDPIDDESSLVQVMAWHHTGAKPLPEPMMTQLTDTYMPWTRLQWVIEIDEA